MRTLSIVVGLLCLFALNAQTAHAKSADAFFKRFQVIRSEDGKLVGIRDRTLPVKFQVEPYVKLVRQQLLEEQKKLNAQDLANGKYESKIKALLDDEQDYNFTGSRQEFDENVQLVVDSLKKLAVLNIDFVFSHESFKTVVAKFESKISDALLLLDPTLIANVNDPTYFYKKNVTYKVVTWALDLAQKTMSNIPLLNTVSYVVVQVEKLITERRQFHQNMLLHYLENFKEEELGLTHDEVNLIWSSIYESRIQWYEFWESTKAKENWTKYGANQFYFNFRVATTNLKDSQVLYTEVSDRANYAFQKVTFNNEKVIVNIVDNESMFQKRPAVAYNYDKPTQISRKRVVLQLAQLGLSFIPMASMIKDNVGNFIKSYYEKQKITEGALYGYFESNGDSVGTRLIKDQYLNPFDGLFL
jgi:hypothetical protein